MSMNNINFSVTGINNVIYRKPNAKWKNDRIFYKNEYCIVIALRGKAEYIMGEKKIPIKKNDILLFPPDIPRAGYTDENDPWEFITINFNLQLPDKVAEEFFNREYFLFKNQGVTLRSKFLDVAYLWEGKDFLYSVKCQSFVLDILYELLKPSFILCDTPHTEKLEAARTYIQANFRKKISIDNLSKRIGLSVSHFRKIFTKAYGLSPQQYIISLRISTAYDLLKSGEVNVSEAATLSGFDDIYYFSALFKKYKGISPSKVLYSEQNNIS